MSNADKKLRLGNVDFWVVYVFRKLQLNVRVSKTFCLKRSQFARTRWKEESRESIYTRFGIFDTIDDANSLTYVELQHVHVSQYINCTHEVSVHPRRKMGGRERGSSGEAVMKDAW